MPPHRVALALALASAAIFAGFAVRDLGAPYAADEVEDLALGGLGFATFLGTLAFAGAALAPGRMGARLGLGPGRLSAWLVGLLALGTLGLSHAMDGILVLSGLKAHSVLPEFEAQLQGIRGRSLALACLSFGFAAGIAEELLCRGLFQRGLERRLGPAAAILLASLIFGALHVDPVHAAFATALGLYLGAIAYLAGSVRPAMVCHVLNNLTAVAAAAASGLRPPAGIPDILTGAVAATGCLGWAWIRTGSPRRRGQQVARSTTGPFRHS